MSKRDIILFDIGRKTTGFSEKNLRTSSEPSPLSTLIHSIPALSFGQHTEQTSHFLDGFHMEYTMIGPAASPATGPVIEHAPSSAARSSGLYLETPYLNENHSHLAPLITHF